MFQPDSFGKISVPSEAEFKYMLHELLVSKLNLSVTEHQVSANNIIVQFFLPALHI